MTNQTQKYKTKLCFNITKRGYCNREVCNFAHSEDELKKCVVSKRYKTKPCKKFTESGRCKYGKNCIYKHGDDDIGNGNEHIKANSKTKKTILLPFTKYQQNKDKISLHKSKRVRDQEAYDEVAKLWRSISEHSKLSKYQEYKYDDLWNLISESLPCDDLHFEEVEEEEEVEYNMYPFLLF